MISDGRQLSNGECINTDVCIVGAGASGITLALELANSPFRVALMESGGLKFRHKTQWLYRGENTGRPCFDLEYTKQRYFGGATNKWAGRCRPMDAIDFEYRPWVPYSGWPFFRKDLEPFYKKAHATCQLGPYNYEPEFWSCDKKHAFPVGRAGIETKIFQFSPPTRFGKKYRQAIKDAKNIKTFLFSNAVFVKLKADGQSVDTIEFATFNSRKFRVRAKFFILAASALENTRLLLASNDVHTSGVGNRNDLVGRFFMEHPHIFSGVLTSILPPEKLQCYKVQDYRSDNKNPRAAGALGLTEAMNRENQLLNACAFFVRRENFKVDDLYFSKEALAMAGMMDMLIHNAAPGVEFFSHLKKLRREHRKLIPLIRKRLKAVFRTESRVTLRTQVETIPNPNSRVMLSNRKDRLGVQRLALDWRLTRQDLDSFRQFQQTLFRHLGNAGIAVHPFNHELDDTGWPAAMTAGKHHMGTTRMHSDPKQGVVDPDCRVHGVGNLYIAGSSVFPTSGQANPMLTVVALAIRMADHIKGTF